MIPEGALPTEHLADMFGGLMVAVGVVGGIILIVYINDIKNSNTKKDKSLMVEKAKVIWVISIFILFCMSVYYSRGYNGLVKKYQTISDSEVQEIYGVSPEWLERDVMFGVLSHKQWYTHNIIYQEGEAYLRWVIWLGPTHKDYSKIVSKLKENGNVIYFDAGPAKETTIVFAPKKIRKKT